jgi:hypothetical protein
MQFAAEGGRNFLGDTTTDAWKERIWLRRWDGDRAIGEGANPLPSESVVVSVKERRGLGGEITPLRAASTVEDGGHS